MAARLMSGKTRSCGCLRREAMAATGRANTTHGMTNSRTWNSWKHMHDRCKSHPSYVTRGIAVCARWASFDAFLADMGPRPAHCTLDRVDNDRGYDPANCRWATCKEQQNNTRSNLRIAHDGVTKTVSEWADHLDVPYHRLLALVRRGVPLTEASKEA